MFSVLDPKSSLLLRLTVLTFINDGVLSFFSHEIMLRKISSVNILFVIFNLTRQCVLYFFKNKY